MTVMTRLKRLERELQPRMRPPTFKVFSYEELVACDQHRGCDVEIATGEHHRDVIHLTFGDREMAQ